LFLLVRVFSFPSLYLVNDKIKIVIIASEVAESEASEKLKCDVRKNTRQKKNMLLLVRRLAIPYPSPISESINTGGGVAEMCQICDRALNLLINLKIISFYPIYYSTILH